MAGLGELVTPARTVWMPGDIRAWLNQINEQIRALDTDIEANQRNIASTEAGRRFLSDFDAFQARWLRFNAEASSWWGNTVSQAQEYVNQYNALESRFRSIAGRDATQAFRPSEAEAPNALRDANYALMGWAIIGIVGIVGLGYLLSNYAKIQTLSKLTLNRPRRRRSRR